jgi:hypothetical protein
MLTLYVTSWPGVNGRRSIDPVNSTSGAGQLRYAMCAERVVVVVVVVDGPDAAGAAGAAAAGAAR